MKSIQSLSDVPSARGIHCRTKDSLPQLPLGFVTVLGLWQTGATVHDFSFIELDFWQASGLEGGWEGEHSRRRYLGTDAEKPKGSPQF